jgi:alpha-tubulin suppressor-like RCC1 family protein
MKFYGIIFAMFFFVFSGFSKAEPLCGKIKQVSCGEYHALALMEDGSLWACGDNSCLQLGVGKTTGYDALRLERVLGLSGNGYLKNISCFDAGWQHSLAADVNGTLVSWGTCTAGQLGNNTSGNYCTNWNVPQKVHGINNDGYLSDTRKIVTVSAGRSGTHSLVVDSNGYVLSFGNNSLGQCGIGSNSPSILPTPVLVVDNDPNTTNRYLGDVARIIAVSAGEYHSLALDANGHVWEWGTGSTNYPRMVKRTPTTYLDNITAISTLGFSMALDANGTVWQWNPGSTPAQVSGGQMGTTKLQNIAYIAAGALSVAVDHNENVWSWSGVGGSPAHVEDGEMQTASGYLENIRQVDSGYGSFQIAVTNDGYGYSWGTGTDGRLGVGDTASRTAPTKMKCPEVSKRAYLTKTYTIEGSEPNCVQPFIGYGIEDNYLVFTISYGNPTTNPTDPNYMGTMHDVTITDVLPYEVDFDSATNGTYDANTHNVVLHLDTLSPGEEDSFEIRTKVNRNAFPLSQIHNYSELDSNDYYAISEVNVPVCNWGGEIIYVDKDANGLYHNGTSWDEAFANLRDALTSAQRLGDSITAVWVAAGTYKPVESTVSGYQTKTFTLPNNLALIGHFGGIGTYETSPYMRNLADGNNTTILEGRIGTTASQGVYNIVTATNVTNGLIDGFTIRNSYTGSSYPGAVYLNDSDVSIVNCRFERNNQYGIYAYSYSYPDIHNCVFFNNTTAGVYNNSHCQPLISYSIFDGNNVNSTQGLYLNSLCAATVEDCIFRNNKNYGICGTNNGSLDISNSQFTNNQYGLSLTNITVDMTDCNIANSTNSGFSCSSSNVTMNNTTIKNSTTYGFYGTSSSVNITNVFFENNTNYSTYFSSSNVTMNNTAINSGTNYGMYCSASTATIGNTTIENSTNYGIYCQSNSNITASNMSILKSGTNGVYSDSAYVILDDCIVSTSTQQGIYGSNADITLSHCLIEGNGDNGIYTSNGCNLNTTNSIIRRSGGHGFELNDDLTTTIKNSWINNNGTKHNTSLGGAGIYFANTAQTPIVRNDTIYDNWTYGVQANQYGPDPNVRNCIIYGNDSNDFYRASGGSSFSKIRYSCLQYLHSGIGNFVDDPMLMTSVDPNNLHLENESPCINSGDPCGIYADETDIDGETRNNERMDCGADESYWSRADYDLSSMVDFRDFAVFANAWLTESETISLDDDNDVDIHDLALFCKDWLWQNQTGSGWMMSMMMSGDSQIENMEMMAMAESESIEAYTAEETTTVESDSLMITDIQASKSLRPKRLADRTNAFYAVTPQSVAQWKEKSARINNAISASSNVRLSMQSIDETESVEAVQQSFDVNETLNWLDDLWQNDETIRNSMTEQQYLEFRQSIENSGE